MSPIRRARGVVVDVSGSQERDRKTDRQAFYTSPVFLFFTSHFLFTSWFTLEYITGILWCPLFSFFPSVCFVFVFIDLGSESLAHLSHIWKPPSSCSVVTRAVTSFTNTTNTLSARPPLSLTICALCSLNFTKAQKGRVNDCMTTATFIFLSLLLIFPSPHLLLECGSFF